MHQRQHVKVHAEDGGNQVQGQEDGRQRGQHAHDVVGAVALRGKVQLDGRFGTLLHAVHVVDDALDVLQHVA